MLILYILIIVAWALLFFSFWIKDYAIGAVSSFFLMVLGVYLLIYGITGIASMITYALGLIQIMIGLYVIIRGAIEQLD